MFQSVLNAWVVETAPRESSMLRDTHQTFFPRFFFSITPIVNEPIVLLFK